MGAQEGQQDYQSGNLNAIVFQGDGSGGVNSNIVGTIRQVSEDVNDGVQAIYGLGSNRPKALQEGLRQVSVQCSGVLLRNGSPEAAGLVGANAADTLARLRGGVYFDIIVCESIDVNGTPGPEIRAYLGCKVASRGNQRAEGQPVGFNMSVLVTDTRGSNH